MLVILFHNCDIKLFLLLLLFISSSMILNTQFTAISLCQTLVS